MDEDIFLARREISQQTSINGVGGIAGAFCDSIRRHDPRRARNLKDPQFNCGNFYHVEIQGVIPCTVSVESFGFWRGGSSGLTHIT